MKISEDDQLRLEKQPVWVQELVSGLVREIDYWKGIAEVVDAGESNVRIQGMGPGAEDTHLPPNSNIIFTDAHGEEVTISHLWAKPDPEDPRTRGINIRCMGSLYISPEGANAARAIPWPRHEHAP